MYKQYVSPIMCKINHKDAKSDIYIPYNSLTEFKYIKEIVEISKSVNNIIEIPESKSVNNININSVMLMLDIITGVTYKYHVDIDLYVLEGIYQLTDIWMLDLPSCDIEIINDHIIKILDDDMYDLNHILNDKYYISSEDKKSTIENSKKICHRVILYIKLCLVSGCLSSNKSMIIGVLDEFCKNETFVDFNAYLKEQI